MVPTRENRQSAASNSGWTECCTMVDEARWEYYGADYLFGLSVVLERTIAYPITDSWVSVGEGRKPGVFMNRRVPTCIAFWSGWRERMESSTKKTLRWNTIVIGDFLNLGGVSH